MHYDLHQLPWLLRAPGDFRPRVKALDALESGWGAAAQRLAQYALDANQLTALAGALDRARQKELPIAPLTPFHLGLVGTATTELLGPALKATALRFGVALQITEASYGQPVQEALDPGSPVNLAGVDAVLLALDYRGLPLQCEAGDRNGAETGIAAALDFVSSIREGFRRHTRASLVVSNIPPPAEALFGSLDASVSGTARTVVAEFNRRLEHSLAEKGDQLLDVAALAANIGLGNWHDPNQWLMAKLPMAHRYVPVYADFVGRLIGAMRGKSRKVLVLDLDNTLWGGVIGDDGLEGIRLGQGSADGEAFVELQRAALALQRRGIVLAVCSKNNDDVARRPFSEHPDMLLRERDIAVFQANWTDKASNLEAIAQKLSLGLDSLVFVDDNPAEREQVRQALPQVAVPEMPEDPSFYSRILLWAGYFESVGFSAEDRARAEQYRANAERVELMGQHRSLDDYLRSLDMIVGCRPFDPLGRQRIAQLINKSNQFNLTTQRYTEAEVERLETDRTVFTLQVRQTDRFGDNGMIAVVICRKQPRVWTIDSWLMSCRVLNRRLEEAVLAEIVREAVRAGAQTIMGSFVPSGRNELVREHYRKLGFALGETAANGTTTWRLDLAGYSEPELPMTVHHIGETDVAVGHATAA